MSYEKLDIDWRKIDGLFQTTGINTAGKTTIMKIITYILFGKTTTTLTPEKYGDNRYINNKRDLDYCLGGVVIDVNGEKYTIERKTERYWNKKKTAITGSPTTVKYYNSGVIDPKNELTDENKAKTQKELDLILGELKDFIRLSFTNSDNLDNALSQNRSIFIDNIIRDAGYDVFEKKLEEFKDYKKELSEEKLIVNVQESEDKISDLDTENFIMRKNIGNLGVDITDFEIELKTHNKIGMI